MNSFLEYLKTFACKGLAEKMCHCLFIKICVKDCNRKVYNSTDNVCSLPDTLVQIYSNLQKKCRYIEHTLTENSKTLEGLSAWVVFIIEARMSGRSIMAIPIVEI